MSPAAETTTPATAEFGMCIFEVPLSNDQVVEISMVQRARETCPGEIHASSELLFCDQVVNDGDAVTALRRVLVRLEARDTPST